MAHIEHRSNTLRLTQVSCDSTAVRTLTEGTSQRSLPFINARNIQTATLISLAYHVALLALFSDRVPLDLSEYWIFFFVDLLMWTVALIPLIAIARKQLVWYDLIALLSIMFFGMVCTFSLAYSLDPSFVQYVSSYGGFALRYSEEREFLRSVIGAELLLLAFLTIVLGINSRGLDIVFPRFSRAAYRAAALTMIICLIGGAIGFLTYWSSRSFLAAITTDIGSLELKLPEAGTARYLMLVNIALTALPLGVVGLAAMLRTPKRSRISADRLLITGAVVSALANLWNGARADVLFAFFAVFAVSAYFGLRIKKSTWITMLAIIIVVIGFLTVVRLNPDVSQDPVGVLSEFFSGRTVREYIGQSETSTGTLLALDRVSAVAMTLEYLRLTDQYLYGESLVAGPVNLLDNLVPRFSSQRDSELHSLRMANAVTFFWRFGRDDIGTALPPSIPGEFYMQAGIAALLVLSVLFGLLILWLRKRMAISTSLIGRWALIVFAIALAKAVPAEVSVLTPTVVYALFPIIVIYEVIYAMLKSGRREVQGPVIRVSDA